MFSRTDASASFMVARRPFIERENDRLASRREDHKAASQDGKLATASEQPTRDFAILPHVMPDAPGKAFCQTREGDGDGLYHPA